MVQTGATDSETTSDSKGLCISRRHFMLQTAANLWFKAHLRPAKEEALLWSEAVLVRRPRLALKGFFVSGIGDGQPAQVGDAFAQNQLAVFAQVAVDYEIGRASCRERV